MLLDLPPEILLHILSFLDLPDLACLSQASGRLALLAADPVLHSTRLRVVAPSRVDHSLFGRSPGGILLRPTLPELVHRGVIRGLHIERRWRMGSYFYSPHSVKQYESGLRLQLGHRKMLLSAHLRNRPSTPHALRSLHVFPDVESSTLSISRTLLPVMHQLKWCIQRDNMAKIIRQSACGTLGENTKYEASHPFSTSIGAWFESKGHGIFADTERVRLAICPDVQKMIKFYENMG